MCSSDLYGDAGCEEKKIPGGATLQYEITLLEMEKEKETWNMDNKEKFEFALLKKDQGNTFFKASRFSIAFKRYEAGLNAIKYSTEWEEEEKKQAESLKVTLNLNMATTKTKLSEWKEALKYAEEALKQEPSNVKALFRKGTVLVSQQEWVEARTVLNRALEVDSENKDIKRELVRLQKLQTAQDTKDKQMFKRMFAK